MIFINVSLNADYCVDPFKNHTPYVDSIEEFRFTNLIRTKLSKLGYQATLILPQAQLNEKTEFIHTLDKKKDIVITFCLGETVDNHSGSVLWYPKSPQGENLGKIILDQLTHSSRPIKYNKEWWKKNPRNRSYLNFLKNSPSASVVVYLAKPQHLFDLNEDYLRYIAVATSHTMNEYINLI